jgi:DNA-binding CsgD family transcriptional regulator
LEENELGNYSRQFISDVPADFSTKAYKQYAQNLYTYPLEAIYIYSFEESKMIYVKGWEEIIGIPDNEISMLKIVELTAPVFKPFVFEMNDKALHFLHSRNEKLLEYSFTIEIKLHTPSGKEVPVCARVGVHDITAKGTLKSIIGRFQVDYKLRFGKIMRFATYGPEREVFEKSLNDKLFSPYRISDFELTILLALSEGLNRDEIASKCNCTEEEAAAILNNLKIRFNQRNDLALIRFAYEHFLIS